MHITTIFTPCSTLCLRWKRLLRNGQTEEQVSFNKSPIILLAIGMAHQSFSRVTESGRRETLWLFYTLLWKMPLLQNSALISSRIRDLFLALIVGNRFSYKARAALHSNACMGTGDGDVFDMTTVWKCD